jgi:hypothetical protein
VKIGLAQFQSRRSIDKAVNMVCPGSPPPGAVWLEPLFNLDLYIRPTHWSPYTTHPMQSCLRLRERVFLYTYLVLGTFLWI